jgi:hypothetical protein
MMDAFVTADKAFASCAARPIEERAKIISRVAQLLLDGRASWLSLPPPFKWVSASQKAAVKSIEDGSPQYSVQSLYTAAQQKLKLIFIVPCKDERAVLKNFAALEKDVRRSNS